MLHQPVSVSAEALDAAVRWENLTGVNIALAVAARWRNPDEQREHDNEMRAEFGRRGLGGPRGLDPEFRETVRALARPAYEFSGFLATPDRSIGVVTAAAGREGVLALRDKDIVTLHSIRPDTLAEVLIAQLPRVPAAHGRSFNLAEADITPQTASSSRSREEDTFGGLSAGSPRADAARDAQLLTKVLSQPRIGGGELHAALRDRSGRSRAAAYPLTYFDTPDGRWLQQITANRTGQRWVVAAPATPDLLVTKLYEMQQTLAQS